MDIGVGMLVWACLVSALCTCRYGDMWMCVYVRRACIRRSANVGSACTCAYVHI